MVEAEGRNRGLYSSDDFGERWARRGVEPRPRSRPWYYRHVIAHPTRADEVFVMNMKGMAIVDSGKTSTSSHPATAITTRCRSTRRTPTA